MQLTLEFLNVVARFVFAFTFVEPVFIMAMMGAFASIRIRNTGERVRLSGIDTLPFAIGLIGGGVATSAALAVSHLYAGGWMVVVITAVVMLTMAFSFRVRFDVDSQSSTCARFVLWLVPWRHVPISHATAWVDGWGDFADPATFNAGDASGAVVVEMGWPDGNSGTRADDLAERFNRAVQDLRVRA